MIDIQNQADDRQIDIDQVGVTMQAYDNPVFVEDMVRNVAARLKNDARERWFRVQAVNQEGIHNHGAFASLQWRRDTPSAIAVDTTKDWMCAQETM